METYRKILLLILAVILLIGCSTNKQVIPSYQYFIVDSVYNGGVYSFTIKDPDPQVEFVFPTGGGAVRIIWGNSKIIREYPSTNTEDY